MERPPLSVDERQSGWDDVFSTRPWGKYPPESLIRFVARHFYAAPRRSDVQILDLGCGTGANTWFMAKEGFSVTALDGSTIALEQAKARLTEEKLSADFHLGFFQELPFPHQQFDAVVDQACITSNPWEETCQIVQEVRRVLKPGGHFYGSFFGTETTLTGTEIEPQYFESIQTGILHGLPAVRLFTEAELRTLFQDFHHVTLEHHVRILYPEEVQVHQWIVEAQCPS